VSKGMWQQAWQNCKGAACALLAWYGLISNDAPKWIAVLLATVVYVVMITNRKQPERSARRDDLGATEGRDGASSAQQHERTGIATMAVVMKVDHGPLWAHRNASSRNASWSCSMDATSRPHAVRAVATGLIAGGGGERGDAVGSGCDQWPVIVL
jgi:hypothetical protein